MCEPSQITPLISLRAVIIGPGECSYGHTLRAAETDAFDASCISDLAINKAWFGLGVVPIAFCTCRSIKPTTVQAYNR